MGMLFAVIIVEIAIIIITSAIIAKRDKARQEKDAFIDANKDLPTIVVGCTLALTVLGAVHCFGLMEMGWDVGVNALWFSIAHAILLCVICLATGKWVRKTGVATVPEFFELLFNKQVSAAVTAVTAAFMFACFTVETQSMGIIINGLTRGSISIIAGAAIAAVIGVLYAILAGMKEIGYVNIINVIIMYAGVIIGVIALSSALPQGWAGVEDYYTSNDQEFMIKLFSSPQLFLAFGLNTLLAVSFGHSIDQGGLQGALSAKNTKTVKKALWVATFVNGLFGVFTVCMGLASKSLVMTGQLFNTVTGEAITAADPNIVKTYGPALIVNMLPSWLVTLICIGFLGAVLSTFAVLILGISAIFVNNVYVKKNPDMSHEEQKKAIRVVMIVIAIIGTLVSFFLPSLIGGVTWAFSWMHPVCVMAIYGYLWKRSSKAALITMVVTWILIALYTFTPIATLIGCGGIPLAYFSVASSLIIGAISTAACPGELGYAKVLKLNRGSKQLEQEGE